MPRLSWLVPGFTHASIMPEERPSSPDLDSVVDRANPLAA
jgi:hypothetical protein